MEPTRTPLTVRTARSLAATPAVPLAVAALAGTALGRHAPFAPPGPLVALALLGIALSVPRRGAAPNLGPFLGLAGLAGLSMAALAAGFLNGHLRGGSPTFVPERERPVAAVVEVNGHWRRLDEVWSAPVRLASLRQGERVVGSTGRGTGIEPVYLHVSAAGSGGPPAPYGARLRVKGVLDRPVRLGNPSPRADAPPGPWRLKVKSDRLVTVERGPGLLGRLAGALRERVEEGIGQASGPGLGASFARALLLGDGSDVPEPVKRAFRRLGLAHLLAVSGLHVGLVAGVALLMATPLGRTPRWLAALAAVGLYLLLVGPRPSLVRASVMACLGVAALLSHRPPSARNALALAAVLLVALRPAAVAEPGLQLSVGATAGLLWLSPWLSARWQLVPGLRRLPRAVRDALAVSAGAQLGTLPWALPLFCLLVPAAPLVNLVAVPWAALLLVASGFWAGTAVLAPGLAAGLLPALDLLASPAGWLATAPPNLWLALPVALGAGAATLLGAGVAAALGWPRFGLPALAAALAWTVWGPASGSALPELVMIDVGQGDAFLLRDGGETLLIDGGGWPAGDLGGRVLLPTLATLGVRSLDGVLATHFDRDHCGGLVQIAGYLPVTEVVTGPSSDESGAGEADSCEAELAALPGLRRRTVAAGDRLTVGRWRLRVLHPDGDGSTAAGRGDNDASVVLLAKVHGRRVLLTGDVEAAAERELLRRVHRAPDALAAGVLKVAHHGSRSSTTPRFLAVAAPSLALVSAGARNPYGHPAPEVLERLRESGARVLRTDRHGMVVLRFHPGGAREIALPGPL
jgi:competence protein ComEC